MLQTEQKEVSDSELWDGIRSGSKFALAQVYDRYVKLLYNYGNKISNNSFLVEDSIQDVFVDLWRYHENLSAAVSVKFYLYAALRRKIVREDQKNSAVVKFDFRWDELQLATRSTEHKIIETETADLKIKKLQADLKNLSPRQYEAIVLRFYDELSYSEIASLMHVNEQSVRNLIQRGFEYLQSASLLISVVLSLCACLFQAF